MVVFAALATCLSAAPPASGVVVGLITNRSGEAVRNMKVTLIDVNAGARHTATTDDEGFFGFSLLPPGEYRLESSLGSFTPPTPATVVLGSGEKRSWRLVWEGKHVE